jgi:predicted acetyltransferase
MQVKVETAVRAPMSRVLDVAKIGGMAVGGGSFTAQIVDPFCPWNQGIWRFEGKDGRLAVSRAAEADCELTIQGLTALIAGAHDPEEFALRGWGSPGAAVQAVQRTMFPRLSPHLHEVF